MLLRQLEYLVSLARERHFARAADACYVSQPSLSAAIRKLEQELDVPIVRRGRRFEGLTPEGERVLLWAQRILAERDALRHELSVMRGGLTGTLRLGAIPTAMPVVSLLTTPFCERHTQARVTLESLSSRDITQKLAEFELDVAMTYLDDDTLGQVRKTPLVRRALPAADPGGQRARRVAGGNLGTGGRTPAVPALAGDAEPADHERLLHRRRRGGHTRDRERHSLRPLQPSAWQPLVDRHLARLAAHVRRTGRDAGGAAEESGARTARRPGDRRA